MKKLVESEVRRIESDYFSVIYQINIGFIAGWTFLIGDNLLDLISGDKVKTFQSSVKLVSTIVLYSVLRIVLLIFKNREIKSLRKHGK